MPTLASAAGNTPVTVSRAAANLPQTATADIFSVDGGMVKIIAIRGTVGTAIQNQANNTKLGFDAGGGSQDICANLDIANDGSNTMYYITGTFTDAMQESATGVVPEAAAPLIMGAGDITLTCAANNSGTISWEVVYIPLQDGAAVTSV